MNKCPYCGAKIMLVDSSVIYGQSYGKAYVCARYPDCDSYVGCHKGTDRPLGTLADFKLREHRKTAHLLFDRLWQSGLMKRKAAYTMLERILKVSKHEAHIARLSLEKVQLLIKILSKEWEGKCQKENADNAGSVAK